MVEADALVYGAVITVGGMAGVAVLSAVVQWRITRTIISSETSRLKMQLRNEFQRERLGEWQRDFVNALHALLVATDPELHPNPTPESVLPHLHRAQLLLNLDVPAHKRVFQCMSDLALSVTKWQQSSLSEVLSMHAALTEAARAAIYLPGR